VITIIGEAFDPLGHSHHGHVINTAELRSRQEDLIALTLDHTELVGRVLTLTRIKGGAVYAVAVADDRCDPFLELDHPIYFSPTTDTRAAGGGDGIVLDLALTFNTARVAAKPVELLAGDVRNTNDRARWSLRRLGLTADLVTRAVDELRYRPKDGPLHIRDLEQEKWRERENERHAAYATQQLARSKPARGLPVPPQFRPGWKPGMLEWSQSGGKILRVS
jgi:hypothetical protein